MTLNLPTVTVLKGVKDDIAQIYLFITLLLKYIKTLSTWLNRIPQGNELYSSADLCLIALNTSGLALLETTVCTKLHWLLPLQNWASLRSGSQSRKISFPSVSPQSIWSSIVSQPQTLSANWWHFGSTFWCQMLTSSLLGRKVIEWAEYLGGGKKKSIDVKGLRVTLLSCKKRSQ